MNARASHAGALHDHRLRDDAAAERAMRAMIDEAMNGLSATAD